MKDQQTLYAHLDVICDALHRAAEEPKASSATKEAERAMRGIRERRNGGQTRMAEEEEEEDVVVRFTRLWCEAIKRKAKLRREGACFEIINLQKLYIAHLARRISALHVKRARHVRGAKEERG